MSKQFEVKHVKVYDRVLSPEEVREFSELINEKDVKIPQCFYRPIRPELFIVSMMKRMIAKMIGAAKRMVSHRILDPHMQFIVDQNRKIREEWSRWHFSDEIEEDAKWW